MNLLFPPEPVRVPASYTYFRQQVAADDVAEINSRGDTIQGMFRQAVTLTPEGAQTAVTASQQLGGGVFGMGKSQAKRYDGYLSGNTGMGGNPYREAFAQSPAWAGLRIWWRNA